MSLKLFQSDEGTAIRLLSAIHVGRCVPVYRKISDIRPKQLRELLHRVLGDLPDDAIKENLPGGFAPATEADRTRRRLCGKFIFRRQKHRLMNTSARAARRIAA